MARSTSHKKFSKHVTDSRTIDQKPQKQTVEAVTIAANGIVDLYRYADKLGLPVRK